MTFPDRKRREGCLKNEPRSRAERERDLLGPMRPSGSSGRLSAVKRSSSAASHETSSNVLIPLPRAGGGRRPLESIDVVEEPHERPFSRAKVTARERVFGMPWIFGTRPFFTCARRPRHFEKQRPQQVGMTLSPSVPGSWTTRGRGPTDCVARPVPAAATATPAPFRILMKSRRFWAVPSPQWRVAFCDCSFRARPERRRGEAREFQE